MKKILLTLAAMIPVYLFAASYLDLQHYTIKPNTTTLKNDLYLRGNIHLSSNTSTASLTSIPVSQGVVLYASGTVSGLTIPMLGAPDDFYLNPGKKLLLDGSGGNTYLTGSSNDMIRAFTNGTKAFEVGKTSVTVFASGGLISSNGATLGPTSITPSQYLNMQGNSKLYFGAGNDFLQQPAGVAGFISTYTNNIKRFEIGTSSITSNLLVYVNSLNSSGNIDANNYLSSRASPGGHYYGSFKSEQDMGLKLALGGAVSDGESNNNLIIGHYDWIVGSLKNYGHTTLSLDPTIFLHSAADPELDANQYLSLSHNSTGGTIGTGKSFLNFKIGSATPFQVSATSITIKSTQLTVPNNFIFTSPGNDFMIQQSAIATTFLKSTDWLKFQVYSGGWKPIFDMGVSSNTSNVDFYLKNNNLFLGGTNRFRSTTNNMIQGFTSGTKKFEIGTTSTTLLNSYTNFTNDNRIFSAPNVFRLDTFGTKRFEMNGSSVTIDAPDTYVTGDMHVTGDIDGTVTFPPGISSMTWTRCYYNLIVSTVGLVTIGSLDGDTAQEYKLNIRLHKGHLTKGSIAMGFNAGANSHSWRIMTTTTTTPTIINGEVNWGSIAIGELDVATTSVYSLSEIYIHAKTGAPRMVNATTTIISAGAVRGTQICSGVWTNTTTNITQILLGTSGTDMYGSGTIIEMWKRN
jgi:hypothetical protein